MADRYTRRYDYILKDIIRALQNDYVGAQELGSEYDSRFYINACGAAHHSDRMDDLLLLRYCSQMLATTFDTSLHFDLCPGDAYTPGTRGFYARRINDALIVTHVFEEARLKPGDAIVCINDAPPDQIRRDVQKNFFYALEPEREQWNGLLKMAETISLRLDDGTLKKLDLRSYPRQERQSHPRLEQIDAHTVYLNPDILDGSPALQELLYANSGLLSGCRKLILDLRSSSGPDPSAMIPLLPYLFSGKRRAGDVLPDEILLTNYTQRNCEWKAWALECAGDESGWPDRLRQRAGEGLTEEVLSFWDDPDLELQGLFGGKLILLTDTWCENAGEHLAEVAQALGGYTLGRPTMGTLDYTNPVTVLCDSDFAITWPMSKRKSAAEGRGIKGKGLPVDEYIPFTAVEATCDLLLQRAIAL